VIAALQSAHADRKALHDQLVQLWNSDNLTEDALNAIVNQRSQSMQMTAKAIVHEVVQVHAVLTPEQRKTLSDNFKKLHGASPASQGRLWRPRRVMVQALLIEDDRKLAALLIEFLGQHGVQATVAGDATQALQHLARRASTSCSSI